jgi:transcriptional regulator with XRE-family HTH domain
MCRNARPFITHPFVSPQDYVAQITSPDEDVAPAPRDHPHAIHLAIEWRDALRADSNLTMAELARQKGLSRARVTQIFNILKLPAAIIKELSGITDAEEARRFPEHALRKIRLLKSAEEQIAAFRFLRDAASDSGDLGPARHRSSQRPAS